MLIHGVDVQNGGQTDMRNHQLAIVLHSVHKVLVEWLLLSELNQVGHFLPLRDFWHLVAWLHHFFLKTLNNALDVFGVGSKAKDYHVFVEVLDPQVLAGFFLAPELEQMGYKLVDPCLKLLQVVLVSGNGIVVVQLYGLLLSA